MRNIDIVMDNAGIYYQVWTTLSNIKIYKESTNKSKYTIHALTAEVVQIRRCQDLSLGNLFVEHTKNEVDGIFANIANILTVNNYYNLMYVYNNLFFWLFLILIRMMKDLISTVAHVEIFWAADFRDWKAGVSKMYCSDISNIKNYAIFWAINPNNTLLLKDYHSIINTMSSVKYLLLYYYIIFLTSYI